MAALNINVGASTGGLQKAIQAVSSLLKNFGGQIAGTNTELKNAIAKASADMDKAMADVTKSFDTFGSAGAKSTDKVSGSTKTLRAQLREATIAAQQLSEKYGINSTQAIAAQKTAGKLKDEIGDMAARINAFNPDARFKAFTSVLQGASGAFGAVTGGMQLFGIESENAQKAMVKLQAIMAITQGLDAIKGMGDSLKTVQASISGATAAFKAMDMVMKASVIGIVIAAVAIAAVALYGAFGDLNTEEERQVNLTKELNAASVEGAKNAAVERNNLDNLYKASTDQTKSVKERKDAQIELQKTYPLTFKNFTDEDFALGKARIGYQQLSKSILAASMMKAKQGLLDKAAMKFAEEEQNALNEIKEKQIAADEASDEDRIVGAASTIVNDKKVAQQKVRILKAELEEKRKLFAKDNAYILEDLAKSEESGKLIKSEGEASKSNIANASLKNQLTILEAAGKDTYNVQLKILQSELDNTKKSTQAYDDKYTEIQALTIKHNKQMAAATKKLHDDEYDANIDAMNAAVQLSQSKFAQIRDMNASAAEAGKLVEAKYMGHQQVGGPLQAPTATKAVGVSQIQGSTKQDAVADMLASRKKQLNEYNQALEMSAKTTQAMTDAMSAAFADTAVLIGQSIGNIIMGTFTMADFFGGLLSIVANFAEQLGKQFIAMGTASLVAQTMLLAGPAGAAAAIGAGIALVAASQVVKGYQAKMSSGGGMASFDVGSNYIPYDMTAQVHRGEMIVPAAANPYANPFSGGAAGGGGKTQVYGRVSGSDIELSSTKYKRWQNRVV